MWPGTVSLYIQRVLNFVVLYFAGKRKKQCAHGDDSWGRQLQSTPDGYHHPGSPLSWALIRTPGLNR